MTAKHKICLLVVAMLAAFGPAAGQAATFAPITGTLAVRAGSKLQLTAPAVLGAASLTDNSFPQGVDFATSSLVTSLANSSLFTFSASASSSTNATAPAGQSQATASTTFQQSFTTVQQQWIELTAEVLSPPAQPNVFSTLVLTRTGQPAPVFTIGHTAGSKLLRQALVPPGVFTLAGMIDTTAPTPGSFAGAIAGSLLIANFADFNGNAVVDGGDVQVWKTGFGSTTGTFAGGNLDGDDDVDGADFLLWQRQFGMQALPLPMAAVPEPSSATLLGMALFAAAMFRSCRASRL